MRNHKKIVFIFCGLVALELFLIAWIKYPSSLTLYSLFRDILPNPISTAHPTSLLETWDIVMNYNRLNHPNYTIAELVSVDHPEDASLSGIPGTDGLRRAWFATIIEPSQSLIFRLQIWDGKVVQQSEQHVEADLKPVTRPSLDSVDAYRIARQKYSWILPNGNSGIGFHFGIGYDTELGQQVLSVRAGKAGESLTNDVWVEIDPTTGAIIRTQVRSFAHAGGILYSRDAGISWQASNLNGQMTTAVAKDLLHIEQGYAVTTDEKQITVYQSIDGGKTWSEISRLPTAAGGWSTTILAVPSEKETSSSVGSTLLVTTRKGAWVSFDDLNWSQVDGLPQVPIQWAEVMKTPKSLQVIVSIIDADEKVNGLYVSTDLVNWNQVQMGGSYRLSISYDLSQVIAIDQNSGKALRFTDTGSVPLNLPSQIMDVAGDFTRLENMVGRFGDSPARNLSISVNSMEKIPDIDVLTAAPDFESSMVIIGGGFRTGIFRSVDSGKTWQQTLQDPSSIVPGNNEIYAVTFLSNQSVIAVNGGFLSSEVLP